MLSLATSVQDDDVTLAANTEIIERSRAREARLARPARVGLGDAWTTGLVSDISIERHPDVLAADVILMYWVGQGFLSSSQIGALMKSGKPLVWRLSDMWAFTGGCHYSHGCRRYVQRCGGCPQLRNPSRVDISTIGWWRKRLAWDVRRLTVLCPSNWMASCARASSLFSKADLRVIATGVDTQVFVPHDKAAARAALGLPVDQPLILFAAADGLAARRKGGHLVEDILRHLKDLAGLLSPGVALLGTDTAPELPLATYALGRIQEDSLLALAYGAADLFVAPYLEDNLPNTVIEAMACGLPVVAFDIGGVGDAVRTGANGITVPVGDVAAMGSAIFSLLQDKDVLQTYADESRRLACQRFDLSTQTQRYGELLKELVDQRQ